MKQFININEILQEVSANPLPFDVEPLDVNIAKIQFNLLKRLPVEVSELGNFLPVFEIYKNEGSYYRFSELKVVCGSTSDNATESIRFLAFIVKNRLTSDEYYCWLAEGNKSEIIAFVTEKQFFHICKAIVTKYIC